MAKWPRYIRGSISPDIVGGWQALNDGMKQLSFALALTHGAVWLSTEVLLPSSFNFPSGKMEN